MIKELVSTLSNSQQSAGLRRDTGRLDSWKEIASYFRREVRTVQLWEKREGLPVHRHFHKQLGSVFAFRSELDAWNDQVSHRNGQRPEVAQQPKTPGSVQGHITICVGPLHNETLGEQSLCDAIAAKTIALLQQLNPRQLSVEVAPSSEQGEGESLPENVAQDSQARYLLEWGIQHNGGGLRVNAELLFVETRTVVWSQVYQCHRSDIGTMPGYLADQIALCVWLKVIS